MSNPFKEFAADHGITVKSMTVETREGWEGDAIHWQIVVTKGSHTLYTGPYSAGRGLAIHWGKNGAIMPNGKPCHAATRAWSIARKAGAYALTFKGRLTVDEDNAYKDIVRLYSEAGPAIEDVLESLQMDMQDADEDFEDWADNLGYDKDSRKAEQTWRDCRAIRNSFKSGGREFFKAFMAIEPYED